MARLWEIYRIRVRKNCLDGSSRADDLQYLRNELFSSIITFLLPVSLIVIIPSVVIVYSLDIQSLAIAYISFGLAITSISLFKEIKIAHRKYLFLALIYSVAIVLIFFMGEYAAGLTILFGATVLSLLILPAKAGVITIFLNVIICISQALVIQNNLIHYIIPGNHQVVYWLSISAVSVLFSLLAVLLMPRLLVGLQTIIERQKKAKNELLRSQSELENSMEEKNTLLAEIHHRVKNNLAVLSGMLEIQAFKEKDENVEKKLLDSTMRIKSMANIHEQLYQSNSYSNMDFDSGLKNLVNTILKTLDGHSKIDINYNIEPVSLSLNQAVPCCLIVNEIITNSIKHAFNEQEKGMIDINIQKNQDHLLLEIIDNGAGFPEEAEQRIKDSLGMALVKTLTQQLRGEYQYESKESGHGVLFKLSFLISDAD